MLTPAASIKLTPGYVEINGEGLSDSERKTLFLASQLTRAAWMYREARLPPESVILEPRGACSLACSYCFVQKKITKELPVDRIADFLSKNETIQHAEIFGGDICDRPDYAAKLFDLLASKRIEFTISTGAWNLNEEMIGLILKTSGTVRVRVQLSLEPEEWGQRVSHGGEHATRKLLNTKPPIHKLPDVSINTVIPFTTVVPEIDFQKWVETAAEIRGNWNFRHSFSPEASEHGATPLWLEKWEADSFRLMHENPRKWLNKCLYRKLWAINPVRSGRVARMSGCSVVRTVSLGPDGHVYSCHEKAVDQDQAWRADDREKHYESVHTWSKMMLNDACGGCEARFVCGGVCYKEAIGPANSGCQFQVRSLKNLLNFMVLHDPDHAMVRFAQANQSSDRLRALDPSDVLRDFSAWRETKTMTDAEKVTKPYEKFAS